MSLSRKNPKRDGNEKAVVAALRKLGVQVWRISGAGVPDLLCHYRGRWSVIEVKKKRGRLTDAQLNTRALAWFPVIESVEQALALFGIADRGPGSPAGAGR